MVSYIECGIRTEFPVMTRVRKDLIVCNRAEYVAQADDISEHYRVSKKVFDRFRERVLSGDGVRASLQLIDEVENMDVDIPVRDQVWFLRNLCPPPNIKDPSPAYELLDWKRSRVNGRLSPNFEKTMRQVVRSAVVSLNLGGNAPDVIVAIAQRTHPFLS